MLFDGVGVSAVRHRVGLVGRNGTGKTTLLKLIMHELEADGGFITLPSRWRIGSPGRKRRRVLARW